MTLFSMPGDLYLTDSAAGRTEICRVVSQTHDNGTGYISPSSGIVHFPASYSPDCILTAGPTLLLPTRDYPLSEPLSDTLWLCESLYLDAAIFTVTGCVPDRGMNIGSLTRLRPVNG